MTGMDRYASRVALLLALGGLMVVLDTTVTFVAVPQLIEQFHSSLAAVQWVTSAYTLALVTVIPTAAWMIDRCGAKRVYLGALMVFLLGSAWRVWRGTSSRSSCFACCKEWAAD